MIDIGGSGVKLGASTTSERRRFPSAANLGPQALVQRVHELTADWRYEVVAIGFPGTVDANRPAAEPGNLGNGWVGFDFQAAFDRPVRVVNDAVLQALGAYDAGRMLFIGLGTGVGSALVTEHVLVPLEVGNLQHPGGGTIFDWLGRDGMKRIGMAAWQQAIVEVIPMLREAFLSDYVVLGGGNAKKVDPLPPSTRRGGNSDAFLGGLRLWEETVEPHDRVPAQVWRVVR